MRTPTLRPSLAWLALAAFAAFAAVAPAFAASPFDGAWRLESGDFVDAEGRAKDYAELKLQGIKLVADGHFSFTTTQDGRFWASGSGTFTADADTYVETPRMASYPVVDGGSYRFRYVLEGDTWTLERHEDGRRVEREVWRRLPATP